MWGKINVKILLKRIKKKPKYANNIFVKSQKVKAPSLKLKLSLLGFLLLFRLLIFCFGVVWFLWVFFFPFKTSGPQTSYHGLAPVYLSRA